MLNEPLKAIQEQLQDGIAKGYWSLEQLDKPSAGWIANTHVDKRTFPDGYQGIQHRNLLRDYYPEAVQASPDPHDFVEPTAELRCSKSHICSPEPTEQRMGTGPVQRDGDHQLEHERRSENGNREGQTELASEGEHAARSPGMPLDW